MFICVFVNSSEPCRRVVLTNVPSKWKESEKKISIFFEWGRGLFGWFWKALLSTGKWGLLTYSAIIKNGNPTRFDKPPVWRVAVGDSNVAYLAKVEIKRTHPLERDFFNRREFQSQLRFKIPRYKSNTVLWVFNTISFNSINLRYCTMGGFERILTRKEEAFFQGKKTWLRSAE